MFFSESQNERQPDVSKSNDPYAHFVSLNVLNQLVFDRHEKNLRKERLSFEWPNGTGSGILNGSPFMTARGFASTRALAASPPMIAAAASRPLLKIGGRLVVRWASVAKKWTQL